MDVRFHCTAATRRSARKAKHAVEDRCATLRKVLRIDPNYGKVVERHAPLRKMRVAIPDACLGKSGGYRAIYRSAIVDEAVHVVFLAVYYKGDMEDLDQATYVELKAESDRVLGAVLSVEWES